MMESIVDNLASTIIPVFNRVAMLEDAVQSVLVQTHRPIEIIISDDGSTDDTAGVSAKLVNDNPDIVRYVHNPNRGPGPARESGRLLARGEFVQYLDSDDRLLPRKFEMQIAALRAHADCGIAYGMTRLISFDGKELAAPFKWTGRNLPTLFPGLLVDRWWCTHTPLYRRSVVDAIGPWSDLRYSQDWEYDARAGALGTRLVNCGEYVSEHCHHEGNRQTGSGRWLSPADRVRFLTELHMHARNAGVSCTSPEMKHFARWVFRNARECGLLGDNASASRLCELAMLAQGHDSLELASYRSLARILGWKRVSQWSEQMRRWTGRPVSRDSQNQSWMT
jgi:glycosyltransferase involved in cell wall biosynthesis